MTLLLAPHFTETVGIDADGDMVTGAARRAEDERIRNVPWRHLRGEDLPGDLVPVQVVASARSFHGMGRTRVAGAAGFTGPRRFEVPGRVVGRTCGHVVAVVLSLSGSAPHLFDDRLGAFEAQLRDLLDDASDNGRFSEQRRSVAASTWR